MAAGVDDRGGQLLEFTVGDQRYALRLAAVDRVVRAVEVTPLPEAPASVLGIINVQGRVVPTLSLRRRFALPGKEIEPNDRFIIVSTARQTFALVADEVHGVVECLPEAIVPATEILPRLDPVAGVMLLNDGMILISDVDTFLSPDQEAILDHRLAELDRSAASTGNSGVERSYEE
jgi:purine-binding chemotaxis protein CheW